MIKRRVLKDNVSYIIYSINVILIMIDIMLLAELNNCYLFYSITLNIIFINHTIIKKYSSKKFIDEYINIKEEV